MESKKTTNTEAAIAEQAPTQKKTYLKPAFRQERLFETGALSCGKVQTSQYTCHNNRKTS